MRQPPILIELAIVEGGFEHMDVQSYCCSQSNYYIWLNGIGSSTREMPFMHYFLDVYLELITAYSILRLLAIAAM